MRFNSLLVLATFSTMAAMPAIAQNTIVGIRDIDEEVDNLRRDAEIDINRSNDSRRFGPSEQREGLSGSLSLSYAGTSAAIDDHDLSFGARLTDVRGPLVQQLGFIVSYGESNGTKTEEDIFAIYDLTYDWNTDFYGFVLGRVSTDGLASTAGDVDTDAFLGIGPGFRIVNTPSMTWRVQAGIGVSYLEYGDGTSETEPGGIVSSRFYTQLGENMFLTNDTDVLSSDEALRANNDLGLNFKVTDAFSTRISYVVDYNESRAERTEDRFGVSLVYGF